MCLNARHLSGCPSIRFLEKKFLRDLFTVSTAWNIIKNVGHFHVESADSLRKYEQAVLFSPEKASMRYRQRPSQEENGSGRLHSPLRTLRRTRRHGFFTIFGLPQPLKQKIFNYINNYEKKNISYSILKVRGTRLPGIELGTPLRQIAKDKNYYKRDDSRVDCQTVGQAAFLLHIQKVKKKISHLANSDIGEQLDSERCLGSETGMS
ncbi:jg22328 [Pararge aegeria aegeria]|uniref:Jg22328 protein n=1 Tax=Pararge aegeria aegeria TaxID=348720 RepID=A0A8S4S4I5_9NEOP|nr:jg22328 [Pararge aegeria aegeria]